MDLRSSAASKDLSESCQAAERRPQASLVEIG